MILPPEEGFDAAAPNKIPALELLLLVPNKVPAEEFMFVPAELLALGLAPNKVPAEDCVFAVIIFSIIPRIVVALIFFIEIIFFNQVHYFIPSLLLLLLIPIIWNIFVSLYVRVAEEILVESPKYIKIIDKGNFEYSFQPLPQYKYEGNDLQEYADTYIIGIKMYVFGNGTPSFKHYQNLLSPYSTLLTSSLYLVGGIYKLVFVLLF